MEVRETVTTQIADGQVILSQKQVCLLLWSHKGQLVRSYVETSIPRVVGGSVGMLVASRASSQEDELAKVGDH